MTDSVGFPTFPPGRRHRKGLAWWAIAWIDAMEDAALEPGRLVRGRTYANTGRVGPIGIGPGLISALVHGNRPRPYRTQLRLQTLDDGQWDAFLDQVGSHAGQLAALLDGDMPHDLVDAAADAGVPLLPGPGDLDPECSCPDWGHPCKHAAALAYQAGWLLGEQPFVLLLMRGRQEARLRDELAARNAHHARTPAGAGPGRPAAGATARQAYQEPVTALPDPPVLPDRAPTPLLVEAAPGVDPALLALLVAQAAQRSRHLLEGAGELNPREQAAQLAASLLDTPWFSRVTAGDPAVEVAARAWQHGGRVALATLDEPWSPPSLELARARSAVELGFAEDERPQLTGWRNRWTVAGPGGAVGQLRYGRDGRWYPYRNVRGEWWPAADPDADPVVALLVVLQP